MYFGDTDLSLLQFRPDSNESKNCSKHFRDSKKWKKFSLENINFRKKNNAWWYINLILNNS